MVVGNGLIAKKFDSYSADDRSLIFASGVSNSKSKDQVEYDREFNLLVQKLAEHEEKLFVYFSTCSINDPAENQSAYVAHKMKIEEYVKANSNKFLIFRVSNLVGRSANVNTVLNFIVHNINDHKHFDLWMNATRNLIDVDDFFAVTDHILQHNLFANRIINIANPENYPVPVIVAATEKHLGKKADYNAVAKGGSFAIDIDEVNPIMQRLDIRFNDTYLEKLLDKYY